MAQFWPTLPPRILRGSVVASNAAYTAVTFPAGYFTQAPTVTAIAAPASAIAPAYLEESGPTLSGFGVAYGSATPSRVDWIAVQ